MSDRFQSKNLSPEEKRALLAQLLQQKAIASNSSQSLFALSHGQQALWFLYKLAPQSWAYNTLFTARIRSSVDVPALRRAFQTLVVRHPSLRTTYTMHERQPLQQIHDCPEVPFEQIDASSWSWDELNATVREAAYRPFDLEQELPLRVSLFTRSPSDRILLLVIHHIASDFWTLLVLMDELRVLYRAQKASTPVSLPPLATSYTDYVQKQADMLAGARGEQWHYWQQQLAGELPVLNLPTDRPRPPIQTYVGASHSFNVSAELTERLKAVAQAEKATLYMTLLAAFKVLLYRYTGQEDILVGSPTFGRSWSKFSEVVGYFVNPLVLRSQLSGNPTFKEFLSSVRSTVLGAIAHQDYPFPLLVERLQPNRDPSHSPMFQVSFAFQKPQRCEEIAKLLTPGSTDRINWGDLELEPFEVAQQEGQFDLTLEMVEVEESLFGVFKYNTDLFDAATIARIQGHFQTLLEAIATNAEQRLGELPVLTPTEKHQLLVEWNNTQTNTVSSATADNLAYVIYTSGSTGKPKGVAIPHQAVNRLVFNTNYVQLNSSDKIAQASNISFDAATFEIWGALLHGAQLVGINRDVTLSPQHFSLQLRSSNISVLFLTTALFNQMASAVPEAFASLRYLLFGGEAFDPKWVQAVLQQERSQQLLHVYGPTESTTFSSYYNVTDDYELEDTKQHPKSTIPIGHPIANTQIYLLDSQLQPVPIGVAGELYIGGEGLARGYLNRPELTAECFIPHPFSQEPSACLYKTGDLGRYRPNGNIEFLGRLDAQVKIRGFRIELGEIEAVLSQHPAVQETVVIASGSARSAIGKEDVPGNKQIVAYIVPTNSELKTPYGKDKALQNSKLLNDLRQFLKQKLPEYVVPSAYVLLEYLPLTSNGKVDRRVLPAPERANLAKATTFVPPRDALERQLVQIWEDTLNVYPLGVQDNFFDLGGHSLLAVRLMAKIHEQFEKNLPLATLFQAGTIEQIALLLRQENASLPWSPLVPIQSSGSKQPFFCIPGAGGNVIYLYSLARYLGSDQPFYGLQAWGLDGESEPCTKVEDMAAQYIKAIQALQPKGPYFLGGHSYGGLVAFEMATQLLHQGHEVALLAILDTPAPLPGNKSIVARDWDNARWLTKIAGLVEHLYETNLEVSYETLQSLEQDEQFNYLKEGLERVNLLPPDAGTTQVRGIVEVYKANCQAEYVPRDIYPGRITLFRSSEEHLKDSASEESAEILREFEWDWGQLSAQPVEVFTIPGDHITMMVEPHVQVLANKLRGCLEQAQLKLSSST